MALARSGGAAIAFLAARQLRRQAAHPGCVVVVPGGGLALDGRPTAWVYRRLQEAASIYKARRSAGEACIIVTLSAGTPHKPMPIDPKSNFQVYEAEGTARSLIHDFAVDAEHVFEENWSLDTIGNAYMLRAMHCDVAGWQQLVVVNNEFHMERTRAIFEKVFSLSPQPAFGPYSLSFVEVPNDGLEGDVLASRKEREAKSAAAFRKNTATMTAMHEMHTFLFVGHLAYASKRLLTEREPVDPKALQTY